MMRLGASCLAATSCSSISIISWCVGLVATESVWHMQFMNLYLSIIALIYKHIQYQIYHQYDAWIKIAQHTVMTHVISTSFWLFAGFSGWKADRLVSSEWKSLKVLLVFPASEWKLGKQQEYSVPIDEWDQYFPQNFTPLRVSLLAGPKSRWYTLGT